ncbi:HD domain-containing protein [Candidatus Palauibacter sp.]|uniref:HD domain-containing protein n=1 Tax=Candidatus Palauibacter sp. TaxID=3101350 RepID=UPI003B59117B
MARIRTIRDPLWGNVRVDQDAAEILDTPQFQRLRRVKQLGFAHLVYPGGVHNRFLHALGVYHLVSRAISCLERDGHLEGLAAEDLDELPVVRLGALLHDVGHYAFSHALEELGPGAIPGDHEEIAAHFMAADPIRRVLERHGPDAAARIGALIRGQSSHPLQGLISGSLDLDKIDYLRRDSLFCGVPYGAVDVDRLLPALTVAREGAGRRLELAVSEKGLSALETLLFSKYQMFRNVYWHHAVRAATLTFVRLVQTALESGLLSPEDLAGPTDEEMLSLIDQRIAQSSAGGGHDPDSSLGRAAKLLRTLVDRRLPKRLVELTGDQLPNELSSWPSRRADLVAALERRMALEWGLSEGAVMLDYPSYPGMLELNLLLVRNDGEVRRLTTLGERGLIDIPRLGRSLHHSARVLRIFSFEPSAPRDPKPVLALIEASEEEVEARLDSGVPLLT